ncbi:MAG TPA: hypothetical protein VHV30_00625 [Polyangiaceae bacterium]|nr:hypothetical protein [Polyangiaceae bacterium]
MGEGCGGGGADNANGPRDTDGGLVGSNDATSNFGDDSSMSGFVGNGDDSSSVMNAPDVNGPLAISPANDVIDVTYGQAPATITFSATINGTTVPAAFSIDRGEIGSIVAGSGVLTPVDTLGGTANVTASYGGQTITTTFTIRMHLTQNGGGASASDAGAGDGGDAGVVDAGAGNAGGNGGVGGEGMGGPVDPGTLAVLTAGPDGGAAGGDDAGDAGSNAASWLYPYDQTVWPRGLLAPLLQWNTGMTFDAVEIHLHENAFDYVGTFAATAAPFIHHPVPQAAWDLLCNSNQGEKVTVTLTFASGGVAYGPITESWSVAQATLTGTVYYNSYGTNLAKNYTSNGVTFGAATLGIKRGATSPVLVAGNDSECRVCHSVSADGSHLVTGNGNQGGTGEDPASAWYDLTNGYAETPMAPADGRFNWGGLSPDGKLLINNGAMDQGGRKLQGSAAEDNGPTAVQLFDTETGAAHASTGLPAGLVVGSPVFSPDGKHVAFNFFSGTVAGAAATDAGAGDGGAEAGTSEAGAPEAGAGEAALNGDGVSLASMDFDPTTYTFSNFQVLFTPPAGYSVWPAYLPTNDAVVFELETQSNGRDWGGTRSPCDNATCASESSLGTKAELWWVDVATKKAARLDNLNGLGYLPTLAATDHTNDSNMNYEPTVNPVPSGGYAWVVFTSRRLYGNVATLKPYWSDPRYVDLSTQPTTKKLWVAAVDLTGTPGSDRSHPAFYLPAQELLAGNSRGYWVVDPCAQNGSSCQTGDQCCGGYCEGNVCSAQPPSCSLLNDKCTSDDMCCGSGTSGGPTCINGRCAVAAPPPPPPVIIAK